MKSRTNIIFGLLCIVWVGILSTLTNQAFAFRKENVDQRLLSYVEDYYTLLLDNCPSHKYNHSKYYTIEFGDIRQEGNRIGYCEFKLNGYHIVIDKKYWDKEAIETEKRQLIYHEMAHCLIYKDHVKDPMDYMNPVLYPLSYEELYRQVTRDIKSYCGSNNG